MKLTKSTVDELSPPSVGYQIHWDDELPGFGVRVTAAGAKAFVLERRIHGRTRRMTICKASQMAPEVARNIARKLTGVIINGGDPITEKRQKRIKGTTVEGALNDYLSSKNLKPRTQQDMRLVLDRYLKAWLKKPLSAISPDMVLRKHTEIGERSQAQANLAMRYLRAVFSHVMVQHTDSEGKPILAVNPVKRLSDTKHWFRVDRRRTVIKTHQLKPWFDAVLRVPANVRDYFLTLVLTGLRPGEGKRIMIKDVDLKDRTFTILDTKNHQSHTLPLSDYLQAMFTRRVKNARGEYLFHGRHGEQLLNADTAVKLIIQDSGIDFCPNDLRRTFATIAESLDLSAYAVKRLLNHTIRGDVTAGYIVTDIERLRDPMQRITDYILKAAGQKKSADILDINKRASS